MFLKKSALLVAWNALKLVKELMTTKKPLKRGSRITLSRPHLLLKCMNTLAKFMKLMEPVTLMKSMQRLVNVSFLKFHSL